MRKVLMLLLGLLPLAASAVTVEVEWQWPTTRVDGAALPLSELQEIVLQYGPCNADGTGLTSQDGELKASPPTTLAQFERTVKGEACLQGHVVDTDGLVSDRVVAKFVVTDPPPPPGAAPSPPVIVRIVLVFPPPPPATVWKTYSAGGYATTGVQRVVDGVKVKAPGSNTVKVDVPCDCAVASVIDTAGVRWCSVGGQLQTAYNTDPAGVARGSPFPANYVAMCREVQP